MSDDYEVGYGKPPKHSQWKKGQSGNPKGKPKGARGLKGDLDRVLRKVITIEGRGTTLKGTTQLLALEMLARRAATGDVRSIKPLIELILTVFGSGDRGGDREQLSERDQKLLDGFLADIGDARWAGELDAISDTDAGATTDSHSCDEAPENESYPDEEIFHGN